MAAGKSRFRAILLMNVTTLAGLLPQLSSQGYDAEKIMPMAVTIAFGMLFTFFRHTVSGTGRVCRIQQNIQSG